MFSVVVTCLGHDYISEVTKPATTVEEGVRTYTCTRCGDTYTEAIPRVEEVHHSILPESASNTINTFRFVRPDRTIVTTVTEIVTDIMCQL